MRNSIAFANTVAGNKCDFIAFVLYERDVIKQRRNAITSSSVLLQIHNAYAANINQRLGLKISSLLFRRLGNPAAVFYGIGCFASRALLAGSELCAASYEFGEGRFHESQDTFSELIVLVSD